MLSYKSTNENKILSRVTEFSCNTLQNNFILNKTNKKFIDYGIPFVIRKYVSDRLRESMHDLHALSNLINDVELPVECYTSHFYNTESMTTKHLTFQEYVAYLFSNNGSDKLYLVMDLYNKNKTVKNRSVVKSIGSIAKFLHDQLLQESLFYSEIIERRVVFLGKDTITQFHYHDRQEAMLHQVTGLKHLYLFPPYMNTFYQMKPYPWYHPKGRWSTLLFSAGQLQNFEEVAAQYGLLNGFKVSLNPGDSLYIPMHWWHIVYGEGVNMSYSDFFRASLFKKYFLPITLRTRFIPETSNGAKINSAATTPAA